MNWSEIQTNWHEMRALLQVQWPKFSDSVLDDIDGDRYELGRARASPLQLESRGCGNRNL